MISECLYSLKLLALISGINPSGCWLVQLGKWIRLENGIGTSLNQRGLFDRTLQLQIYISASPGDFAQGIFIQSS